jgi:hypothetical protein
MRRCACLLTFVLSSASHVPAQAQDNTPPPKNAPDGVYAVLRESLKEKDVLPLKDGERLIVHHHRYLKDGAKEPPRFLVVRPTPDVMLDLAEAPQAVKEGDEVVRILLKLKPRAATALKRVTTDQTNKHVAIVLGGEVVTAHKIREAIKGGNVQITSCAAGAAKYLLEQLRAHYKNE